MKKLIIISIVFSLGLSSVLMGQSNKETRKERKKAKAEKYEQLYQNTKNILESKEFVLEAHYLGNKYGQRIPVSSSINFIKVDSSEAVLQIGSHTGVGYNGLGGITTDGRITAWELNKNDKKNNFNLSMNVMTSLGNYDIFMNISADGYTTARVHDLRGGQLTYTGNIIPQGNSQVYEGTSTY